MYTSFLIKLSNIKKSKKQKIMIIHKNQGNDQRSPIVEEKQRDNDQKIQEQKKQSEQVKMNGIHEQNSDEQLERPSQSKNQNQQESRKSSGQQSQQQNDEQDKSSVNDENKSERDEEQDDSNVKSDDKDDQQQNSGEDLKREEPSGKKCFNKQCSSKKIYKKLRSKVEHAKYRFLCKPCYENYCDNNFCEFCEQIYSNTSNTEDDDQWIGCDKCNRWNHIQCEKKYRNKNIHDIKDQNCVYLCLTCSYKPNQQLKGRQKQVYDNKLKPRPQICKDQRIPIFNKKIQNLPSLQYFLQNYNFRLWINENLIKDDIEILRAAQKRYSQQEFKKNKKIKME